MVREQAYVVTIGIRNAAENDCEVAVQTMKHIATKECSIRLCCRYKAFIQSFMTKTVMVVIAMVLLRYLMHGFVVSLASLT